MTQPLDLDAAECRSRISEGGVGRVAFTGPDGPEIFPVNFTVVDHAVLFRTSTDSLLGRLVDGSTVAFETDKLNERSRSAWSVIVKGVAEIVDDDEAIDRIQVAGRDPNPWATDQRQIYVRIPWTQITGRQVGPEALWGS